MGRRAHPGGSRLGVVIPIGVEALREVIDARSVRGLLGKEGTFLLPVQGRRRLASLLRQMPEDGAPVERMRAAFRATDLTP